MVLHALDSLTTSARVTVHAMHIGRAKGELKQNWSSGHALAPLAPERFVHPAISLWGRKNF